MFFCFKTSVLFELQDVIKNTAGQKDFEWLPPTTKAKDLSTFINEFVEKETTTLDESYRANRLMREYEALINMVNTYE